MFKGNLWILPEGVADFLVCKLRDWVVSFIVCVVGGWCGIVQLLPSLVVVDRGVSRAKFVFLVHVCLKFVAQIGEIVYRESLGAVHAITLCGRGLLKNKSCGKDPWHLERQCLWCERGLRCERKRQPPRFL